MFSSHVQTELLKSSVCLALLSSSLNSHLFFFFFFFENQKLWYKFWTPILMLTHLYSSWKSTQTCLDFFNYNEWCCKVFESCAKMAVIIIFSLIWSFYLSWLFYLIFSWIHLVYSQLSLVFLHQLTPDELCLVSVWPQGSLIMMLKHFLF